jgi:hypothetical protein
LAKSIWIWALYCKYSRCDTNASFFIAILASGECGNVGTREFVAEVVDLEAATSQVVSTKGSAVTMVSSMVIVSHLSDESSLEQGRIP